MAVVRAATAADAEAIRALVRSAPRMNPTGLDWPNFVVAEVGGGSSGWRSCGRRAAARSSSARSWCGRTSAARGLPGG